MPAKTNITTNRLLLRPPENTDIEAFTKLASTAEIAEQTFVPHPYNHKEAEAYFEFCRKNWETGAGTNFVIIRKNDGQLVGSISYKDIDRTHRRAEFGYWIGKPYWGNGYATEAIKMLVKYGFEQLNLHRIYATPFGHNKASQRVLYKNGLKREGMLKDHIFHRGQYRDLVIYGMTVEQFSKLH